MMKAFLLFCSFFIFTICSAQTASENKDFPACEEVLTFVVKNMKHYPASGAFLSLAKKKEGYFLIVQKYEDGASQVVRSLPVWNRLTGEFAMPDWTEFQGEASNENAISEHFTRTWGDLHNYDFYKFYGYPEASLDLIEDLKSTKEPTLYECELLARAHSNIAQRYFHPYIGGIPPSFAADFVPSNYEKIPKDRLKKAKEHIDKSMMYWKHIGEVNPNYEPHIITNIQLKTANEYMHFWSLYISVRESKLAQAILDQVEYAESDIAVAKRMLDICQKNAFLLANGDNDTYPIWYVQEKMEYRTDVVLLNTSLMQTDWYRSMCKERGKYQTNFTQEDYKTFNAFAVILMEKGEASIESIIQQKIPELNGKTPEKGYLSVPEKITINLGNEQLDELEIDSYLYMWQLALLDIIISNPNKSIVSSRGGNILKDIGFKRQVAGRGSLNELVRGGLFQTNLDRDGHVHLKKQLDNIDLSKINDTYLTQFEFQNLVHNLSQSRYIYNDEYVAVGTKLMEGLSFDLLKNSGNPGLVRSSLELYDQLKPEDGILLRDAYLEKAQEMIDSLSIDGVDFLQKLRQIEELYRIYSGRSFFDLYTHDDHEETEEHAALLKDLEKKVQLIKLNLYDQLRMRTSSYVNFVLSKMDDL
jgi:hypothetical protein